MSPMTDSPLAEATLQSLFARNPEELSDAEFARIVADFRHERHAWNKLEATKRSAPSKKETVARGSAAPSLDDLLDGI